MQYLVCLQNIEDSKLSMYTVGPVWQLTRHILILTYLPLVIFISLTIKGLDNSLIQIT